MNYVIILAHNSDFSFFQKKLFQGLFVLIKNKP